MFYQPRRTPGWGLPAAAESRSFEIPFLRAPLRIQWLSCGSRWSLHRMRGRSRAVALLRRSGQCGKRIRSGTHNSHAVCLRSLVAHRRSTDHWVQRTDWFRRNHRTYQVALWEALIALLPASHRSPCPNSGVRSVRLRRIKVLNRSVSGRRAIR